MSAFSNSSAKSAKINGVCYYQPTGNTDPHSFVHCVLLHGDTYISAFKARTAADRFVKLQHDGKERVLGIWQPKGTRAAELGHYRGFGFRELETGLWAGSASYEDIGPVRLVGANPTALCLAIDEFLADDTVGEEE